MGILSITPSAGIISATVQDLRFDISARVMKEMLRAERGQVPAKRKFIESCSPGNVRSGQALVRDCLWLPARQAVWYAVMLTNTQNAGIAPFSKNPKFMPSNEFLLEVSVKDGKWTMRDRSFGILPISSDLLVPLRE